MKWRVQKAAHLGRWDEDVKKMNKALEEEGVTKADLGFGYPGDENAAAGTMFIKPGLWIRLSRNLDKQRGFVNGALAQVRQH